jgi:hypothetical protein
MPMGTLFSLPPVTELNGIGPEVPDEKDLRDFGDCLSSEKLFHAPQSGHLPNHLGLL